MKKIFILSLLLCVVASVSAQTDDEQRRSFIAERQANMELTSQALGKKVTKLAKKEAKRLQKEGWQAAPGGLPVENQLTEFYIKMYEHDGSFPRYIIGRGQALGGNYAAARKQALALATVDIAAMIEAEVTELTEQSVGNSSLNDQDAQSIAKSVSESKIMVEQSIGNLQSGVEIYRDVKGKKEVSIQVLYDGAKARATILQELSKASKELHDKFEKISK